MGKLDGKGALITGSGRNIGRAIALKLAQDGAYIIVNARANKAEAEAVAREVREKGVKALAVLADVAKKSDVDAMVSRAVSEFGRIDILINNAAIRPHKPFTEVTIEDWERVRGVVSTARSTAPRRSSLRWLRTAMAASSSLPAKGRLPAAAAALTSRRQRWASSGWAGSGLGVRAAKHPRQYGLARQHRYEARQSRVVSRAGAKCGRIPLGRQGHVDEIAATCLFLVSDDGGFITGQTIHVNGGAGYY